jgi:2-polyprenyl-3-methyl-5-hydroxy-6-metoxy-1,4-benzoquinol methylase
MILEHWRLEKELANQLRTSTPDNRWETFERCYTALYAQLDWLNPLIGAVDSDSPEERYRSWSDLLGPPPKKIYEIGSGQGNMIRYLASLGHLCKGTEITRERGKKHVSDNQNINWGNSDGVHFDRFEDAESYDCVLSDQVIEHLHPDDLTDHFRGVLKILRAGGSYIFATPHTWYGPSDVSRVFKRQQTFGMHLKEYTYGEINSALGRAGFRDVFAVYMPKSRSTSVTPLKASAKPSKRYLAYLCVIEKLLSLIPRKFVGEAAMARARSLRFPIDIFILATKSQPF